MQKFILSELDRRFQKAEFLKPLAIATILDPRFKKNYFQSAFAVSQAVSFISNEMMENLAKAAKSNVCVSEKESIDVTVDSLWALHDEHIKLQQQTHSEDIAGGISVELRQYLNRPVLSMKVNPFQTWDAMKSEYPNLYKQAMKYLPVTATSVPSERLFPKAKLVLTNLRSRLTPEHFSQLLFLSSVSSKLWKTT